jgi:hypothetical protein
MEMFALSMHYAALHEIILKVRYEEQIDSKHLSVYSSKFETVCLCGQTSAVLSSGTDNVADRICTCLQLT